MEASFHDHSSFAGKFQLLLSRVRWPWVALAVASLGLVFLAAKGASFDSSESELLQRSNVGSGAKGFLNKDHQYYFLGTGSDSIFSEISPWVNQSLIQELIIINGVLDITRLSQILQNATNIEGIRIRAASLNLNGGNRVFLPKLKSFEYEYLPFVNAEEFKGMDTLKDILFFDQNNTGWDFQQDVTNLGVNITVVVNGTKILEINEEARTMILNVHYCEDLLENVRWKVQKLSLNWCTLTNASVIPDSVKYLNLNNALPPPEALNSLLKSLSNLEEFHAYQPYLGQDDHDPGYFWSPENPSMQIPLLLENFPPTLRTLSLCRLALTSASNTIFPITDLSLEEVNVSSGILQNFPQKFPQLQTVRLFSLKSGDETSTWGPDILEHVLKTKATEIVAVGYVPKASSEVNEVTIDQLLSGSRLNPETPNFVVVKNDTGSSARKLRLQETNYKRYESMGFQDIDTFPDYLVYDALRSHSSRNLSFSHSLLPLFLFFLVWRVI